MKAKIENNKIKVYPNLPTHYGNVLNGYDKLTERHEKDGFFDVIVPTLKDNEKKGEIYFDDVNKVFTYPIIVIPQKTQSEIETENILKATNLRSEYSQRISDIVGMREAIEKNIIDGIEIPQDILDEREQLKIEYNQKLSEL